MAAEYGKDSITNYNELRLEPPSAAGQVLLL